MAGNADASPRLRVLTITEAHCRYEVSPDRTSNVRHSVPGAIELVPVREADGGAVTRPHVEFSGCFVAAGRTAERQ